MRVRFVPLDITAFPSRRPDHERKRSQFKAPWIRTMELLDRELMNLGASDVVIQAGFRESQIRNDGWPIVSMNPSHPAVILNFRDVDNRALSFPCDRFETYAENIRAIALSLEALRAVDRFGVTKRSEQYAGFRAIEAPRQWTVEDAARFLAAKIAADAALIILTSEEYRRAYRFAAKLLHPDAGGNPHEWKLLGDAKAVLDLHHGIAEARL